VSTEPDNFWKAFDDCQRQVREAAIISERIVPLRSATTPDHPPLTPEQRELVTLQGIARGIMQLRLGHSATPELLAALDEFDTLLEQIRFNVRLQLGLVCLAGKWGWAP
jgi:hypothetical protein